MSELSRDEIREIALACGLEPKQNGDLAEHIYLFADRLVDAVRNAEQINSDNSKVNADLISENERLEARVAGLEKSEAEYWWKLGMANARRIIKATKSTSNQSLFMNLFGTGLGTAGRRCIQIGLDPESNKSSLNDMAPFRDEADAEGGE